MPCGPTIVLVLDEVTHALASEPLAVAHHPIRLSALSPREVEVLDMMSLGLTNAQLAERLNVTVHAVKFHLASIYNKLGVANRTEAAAVYLRQRQD
jgi:DNA-binding NarL/FixJ family response regulator